MTKPSKMKPYWVEKVGAFTWVVLHPHRRIAICAVHNRRNATLICRALNQSHGKGK